MHLLQLIPTIVLALAILSTVESVKAGMDPGIGLSFQELRGDKDQSQRFLRSQYDDNGNENEERGFRKVEEKLGELLSEKKVSEKVLAQVSGAEATYPGFSQNTLKQLKAAAIQRAKDAKLQEVKAAEIQRLAGTVTKIKSLKTDEKSLRRDIPHFNGMNIPPAKYLKPHLGRDYDNQGRRLLAMCIVSQPAEKGNGQVLLISSSNPTRKEWMLPKGGWAKGESGEIAALRELIEEGGVGGTLMHKIKEFEHSERTKAGKTKGYVIHPYLIRGDIEYDDWAESKRLRIWVSFDEAIQLLGKRQHMVGVVRQAKTMYEEIESGKLTRFNPKLSTIKLEDTD